MNRLSQYTYGRGGSLFIDGLLVLDLSPYKKPHSRRNVVFLVIGFKRTGIYGAGGDRTRVLAYCQLNVYTHRQTT